MKTKTETGRLMDGITYNDAVHYDFELRLPLMADTGHALDATEDRMGTVEGYAADTYYRAALMSLCLVKLGDIPYSEITADLFYERLTEDDYIRLKLAQEQLRQKRSGGNPGSPDSVSPRSPSDATA